MDRVGLGWVESGLGWVGLDCVGVGWVRIRVGLSGLCWVGKGGNLSKGLVKGSAKVEEVD